MKKKTISVEVDKGISMLSKIEKNREKLHNMINTDKNILVNDDTVNMSQYLDSLIVEYIKYSWGEQAVKKANSHK